MKRIGIYLFIFILSSGVAYSQDAHQYVEQGLNQGKKHNWVEALISFEKAVKKDPSNSLAWANHGTALLNLGKPNEAIESYERAKNINAHDPYIFCSLASARNRLHQPKKALQNAETALVINPSFAPAMVNKAKALEALGRHEEAELFYQKAFALNPDLKKHVRRGKDSESK